MDTQLAFRIREESGALAVLLLDDSDHARHVEATRSDFSDSDVESICNQVSALRKNTNDQEFMVVWDNRVHLSFMYRKANNGAIVVVFRDRSEMPSITHALRHIIDGL